MELVSPALPGRFLTAEPPGKSPFSSSLNDVLAGTGEGEEGPGEDVSVTCEDQRAAWGQQSHGCSHQVNLWSQGEARVLSV